MGVEPDKLFSIIHEANMTKIWPDGSIKYREDGKVLKPSTWKDPKNRILNELYRQYRERNPLP
jgi:predicted HAD superfamily Cof-like phosphohydrolase